MKKLAEFVIRYRWAVIVFFLALTAFMGFQMKNASFNPDLLTYLPEHLPSRMNQKQIEKMFGGTDMVMIVVQTDDVVNGMLNYGYTILRGRVLTRVISAGLSPTLSLFHRNRSNAFALVDDLMEPFRPAVDYMVYRLLQGGSSELGSEEKTALVSVLAEKVSDNQDFTVRSVIENFCSEFALYVEGKRDTLKVPIWKLSMSEPGALKEGE